MPGNSEACIAPATDSSTLADKQRGAGLDIVSQKDDAAFVQDPRVRR